MPSFHTRTREDGSFQFAKLPRFSPELFAKVTARDVSKYKQFHKSLSQLAEEGAVQLLKVPMTDEIVLGVVGELQFEVFQHRLNNNPPLKLYTLEEIPII